MPLCYDTWASPRRARLAENHGKPSLGVFITDPWYKMIEEARLDGVAVLGERPTLGAFAGMALIFVGLAAVDGRLVRCLRLIPRTNDKDP